MYQFTSEEIETMTEAQTKALKYIKESEFPIHVEDKFAREFLALRILSLFREGERNPAALANSAISQLRERVQVKQSARTMTRA